MPLLTSNTDTLDADIHTLGEELHRLSQTHRPIVLTKSWIQNEILKRCLEDEAFKVHVFQFLDVLPILHTPAQTSNMPCR